MPLKLPASVYQPLVRHCRATLSSFLLLPLLQVAFLLYIALLRPPVLPPLPVAHGLSKRGGWTYEGSVARSTFSADTVHIVTSWCSVSASDPAMASLKSILLADAQHGAPEGSPLAFHIFTDAATTRAWRRSDPMFLEVRAILARHPARYSVRMLCVDDLDDLARAGFEAEAAGAPAVAALPELTRAVQAAVSFDSTRFRCAAARLLSPLVLRDLQRYIYLDYDTVTLCDIRRLQAVFASFPSAAALGLGSEFPSPAVRGGYYSVYSIPTGVPNGVNSGVILFDLPRLRRAFGSLLAYTTALAAIIAEGTYAPLTGGRYSGAMPDQDVLNVLAIKHPGLVHVLSPTWHTVSGGTGAACLQYLACCLCNPPHPNPLSLPLNP